MEPGVEYGQVSVNLVEVSFLVVRCNRPRRCGAGMPGVELALLACTDQTKEGRVYASQKKSLMHNTMCR